MAVTQNLKGTSYPSFKIHKSGPTLFQGDVAPSFSASHGDLYLQTGTEGALWLYENNQWRKLGSGGTSTDTTIITNSTNTGSYVQQYVLHGETTDANEHILAPTTAFSIDTTTTTLDTTTLTIDTGTTSGIIPVPLNSANLFEVRVVARSANPNNNAGYTLKGVIVNDAGTTTLVNDATENILAESTTEWYALVEANDNGDDSFVVKVSGSANTVVRWTAFVSLTSVATPSYGLSPSSTAINEGDTVTFTLTTNHITDGSIVAYTITGIDQADLSSGSLTGNFVVNNNTATLSFTLAEDATTEGTENMTLALNNGLASADVVVVTDTSLDPTYTLSADNTTINEGDTVTITLTTTNIADGTDFAYTVTGVDTDDLSSGSLTGNITINSNTGTAAFTLAEDSTTEGAETLTLTLDNGEGSIDITITDTSLNAPSTPNGYQPPQNLAPTSNGGTTTKFIGEEDYSVSANDNYAIVTEAPASAYDGSTYVKNIGWCYLFDMNTGTVVKSWNPLIDGDHSDDGSLASWTPGGSFTQASKYHTAYCGKSTAINSEYAFLTATFNSYNQVAGAYVFVYKLSDYSIAKVFRLADIPNIMPDDGNGASANTDYGYYGIHATENWLAVGARRVSTPGGSTNNPATSEQEGAIFIYDISDANPANWSFAKHLENPVPNSARTVGPAGWFGNFGSVMHISDTGNYMYTNHGGRSYKYALTNNTWASNPVTMWGADPFSNSNYNPTDLDDVYFDQDHSKLDGNILYWADIYGDVVKAYNLDTETLLWTSATYENPRSIDLSSDKVWVQAEENSQYKIYALNKSDGTLAETFASPNHGTGVERFGKHFGVTSDGKLIAAEQDTNSEHSYMLLFKPTANLNYVEDDYVVDGYISNPVASSALSNFVVDTGATFSANANNIRPHGSSSYNWYGNSGLSFNADGTQMYWKETSSWYGFTLSTPYDTGTAVRDTSLDPYNYNQSNPFQNFSDHGYTVNYHTWSADGRRYFLSGGSTAGAGWDIRPTDDDFSLVGVPNIGHNGSAETSYQFSWYNQVVPDALGNADNTINNSNIIFFNDDGTKIYMAKWEGGYPSGYVTQYDLATPYTCNLTYVSGSELTSIHTKNLLTQSDSTITQGSQSEDNTLEDVKWSSDGTMLFMLCESNIYDWVGGVETKRGPTIYQVDCSTPYDITTASYTQGNHIVLREAGIDTTGCYPSMAVEGNQIWVNVYAPTITGDSTTYTGTCLVKLHVPSSGGGGGGGSGNPYGDRGIIFNASSTLDGGNSNHSQRIEYFDITTTGNAAAFGLMTQKQDVNNNYNSDRGASNGNRAVACLYHGPYPGTVGSLEYVATATLGNSVSFGTNTFRESLMGLSDGTKAYYAGGPFGGEIHPNQTNLGTNVEVITIDTTGNATDTGYGTPNLTNGGTHGNTSRGIFAGGREDYNTGLAAADYSDQMYYIAYPLSAGASDFGNLIFGQRSPSGTGSDTIACFTGGQGTGNPGYADNIEYVTIATPGNASSFGDLTTARVNIGATGNNTRGVFIGGYSGYPAGDRIDTMEYITFATPGNAVDFGDMTAIGSKAQAMSGNAS